MEFLKGALSGLAIVTLFVIWTGSLESPFVQYNSATESLTTKIMFTICIVVLWALGILGSTSN